VCQAYIVTRAVSEAVSAGLLDAGKGWLVVGYCVLVVLLAALLTWECIEGFHRKRGAGDDGMVAIEARRQVLAEVKRLRARGEELIRIAIVANHHSEPCPPGTEHGGCIQFASCGSCWTARLNSTDEEWRAILEGKGGDAE